MPDDVFAADAGPDDFPISPESAAYAQLRFGPDPAAVRRAVELLDSPIATTLTGKGAISETHPLAIGVAGRFGVPVANSIVEEADCVIFIGCKTGQSTTLNWTLPDLDTPVIHIDVDPNELGRSYHATVALAADAKLGTAALADAAAEGLPSFDWDGERIAALRDGWWDGPIEFKRPPVPGVLKPQDLMRVMRQLMSDDDLFVSDASLASGWIASRWQIRTIGGHFFAPRGFWKDFALPRGPGDDITYPTRCDRFDYEGEVVAVIGAPAGEPLPRGGRRRRGLGAGHRDPPQPRGGQAGMSGARPHPLRGTVRT